jgi:histidyl-tRNA synthetase
MTKISTVPPSGFRDFTPAETAVRQYLVETIAAVYQRFGFQQIALSALENLSTLQGKGGGSDNEKLIFKVLKRGEELERAQTENKELADLGMRFDLTLPLARYYARFQNELPRPFKVFQMGPVWRADRPQKGRFREFVQCDVDVLGSKEIGAEVEALSAILAVFDELEIKDLELHLNDRAILLNIGKSLGLTEETWQSALVTLDKLDKIGPEKVIAELESKNIPASALKKMEETSLDEANDLAKLIETLKKSTRGTKVIFNPTLVRGQDYYTGTIFEVRHPELSGSLAGGGRYNRLLEIFGGQETPAFGGSIGFERLAMLMKPEEKLENNSIPQVFFPLMSEEMRSEIAQLANSLRSEGVRVDVYPDAAKLKNQFKYADDRKIPFTAILGDSEKAAGEIKWKDMNKREEKSVKLKDFKDTVLRELKS